jgi:hypothetical protein
VSIEIFGWMAWGALIGAFLVAAGSLIGGLRRPERAGRAAVVCLITVALLVVLGVVGWLAAMLSVFSALPGIDPASRSTALARGISEAMNCAGLVALGAVTPTLSAFVLFVRSRAARSRARR